MAGTQAPLAERIRPHTLTQFIGQRHLTGPSGPLTLLRKAGMLPSMIFWGPPGVGKTTLARILASETGRPFQTLSAVQAGVKDVRAVLETAREQPGMVLFIDEIHRFNKAQQDALLPAVEQGLITLIGATTENPSFEVISALLSRCQTYVLYGLTAEDLTEMVNRGIQQLSEETGREAKLQETEALFRLSGGDGRKVLNLLELIWNYAPEGTLTITNELVQRIAQQKLALYDKGGEQHYDIISAFIKSIRGSDPNAGLYWLARMLEGGEDIRFIARRLVISAAEDIGNANPNGLLLANACFEAIDKVGMPEGRIILAQCVTYLATSAKSNASYIGINKATDSVRARPDLPVPLHIRNAPTKLMKEMGYGSGYKYSHDYVGEEGNQEYLPAELSGTVFYEPKEIGREKEIAEFLKRRWAKHYKTYDS